MPKVSASPPAAADSAPRSPGHQVPPAPDNYEAALRELEALVRSMEAGELPLDQLLSAYQRGAVLLNYCRAQLQAVQDQVKLLDDGALKVWKSA